MSIWQLAAVVVHRFDIIPSHHGDLSAESEVGRGSRITIRLPIELPAQ